MKKLFIVCAVALSTATNLFAQEKSDNFYGLANRVGVGVGVGTEGIGIDAATSLNKYFSVRFGLNFIPDFNFKTDVDVSATDITDSYLPIPDTQVEVKASLARTMIDLKFDCYPFPDASSFFVTAGFSFSGSKLLKITGHSDDLAGLDEKYGIDIDEYHIPFDANGDVEAGVKVNGFRPYLGLGFGRLIPKNRLGFRFELGVQFHGTPKIYATGFTEEELKREINEAAEENDISDIMDKLNMYPCIKLSLRGRIL